MGVDEKAKRAAIAEVRTHFADFHGLVEDVAVNMAKIAIDAYEDTKIQQPVHCSGKYEAYKELWVSWRANLGDMELRQAHRWVLGVMERFMDEWRDGHIEASYDEIDHFFGLPKAPYNYPETTERESGDDYWLIRFNDPDRTSESFGGAGAELAAKTRYKEISASWNATLFRSVKKNWVQITDIEDQPA